MNPNYNYEAFEEWVKTRPPAVQAIARKYIPDSYYLMNHDPERLCTLHSYNEEEDGTITLKVDTVPKFFPISYRVFGIKPESLTKGEYIT